MFLLDGVSMLTLITICQNVDMGQDDRGVDLQTSLGYLVKEVSSGLRAAMEAELRPLGMNITHYACLELLAQRPGSSNSELARGAFVTRQAMNVLLQALETEGSVQRPARAVTGRILPAELTDHGRRRLAEASARVRLVEVRMRAGLTDDEEARLRSLLATCASALQRPDDQPLDGAAGRST